MHGFQVREHNYDSFIIMMTLSGYYSSIVCVLHFSIQILLGNWKLCQNSTDCCAVCCTIVVKGTVEHVSSHSYGDN